MHMSSGRSGHKNFLFDLWWFTFVEKVVNENIRVFITSCEEVLDIGDIAVVTAHKSEIPSFERTTPKKYHVVKLDISDSSDIQLAFATAFDKLGRVDVMINNVGYSRSFEELSDSQIKRQVEVNFLDSINVVIMTVEVMRD